MSTAAKKVHPEETPFELESGDHMTREDFHRVYAAMPEGFKAELVGGIVYVASPLKRTHGTHHVGMCSLFAAYVGHTPGVEACDNTTTILSDEDEVQPDLSLRILPEFGGQSRDTKDDYIKGAPELLAEISHSSRAIDLHEKRQQYQRAGVLEYIVICLRPRELHWFDLRSALALTPDAEGILRSDAFPGLWIHHDALLQLDYQRVIDVLQQGMSKAEHAAFISKLAKQRKR